MFFLFYVNVLVKLAIGGDTLKIKDGYVMRQIAGQCIAIPVGNRVNDLHGLIALNESGAFIWNQLKDEKQTDELVKALTEEYEVSEKEAKEAVLEYLELLKNNNLLEE
jgi:hypothetical protein